MVPSQIVRDRTETPAGLGEAVHQDDPVEPAAPDTSVPRYVGGEAARLGRELAPVHRRLAGAMSDRPASDGAPDAGDVAATFCATLVDEWVRCGLTDAVVAPGSRSTPMALALVRDDRMRVHVFHDERSAAFCALGLGLATGRPALVLCTSGTAAVELHAAVVEAAPGRRADARRHRGPSTGADRGRGTADHRAARALRCGSPVVLRARAAHPRWLRLVA